MMRDPNRTTNGKSGGILPVSIVLGSAILFIVLDLSVIIFDNLLLGAAVYGIYILLTWCSLLVVKIRNDQLFFHELYTKVHFRNLAISLVIACLTLVPLSTSGGFAIKQRVGPDGIGWASSAQYFSLNNSTDPLRKELSNAVAPLTIDDVFDQSKYEHGKSPIYQIQNYSVQINSEFLIGAKRISGPGFLGLLMRIFGFSSFEIIPFAIFFFNTLSIFVLLSLLRNGKQNFLWIFATTAVILSVPYQTVILEGGIGNLFSFPFVAVLLLCFLTQVDKSRGIILYGAIEKSFIILIAGSISLYSDSIFAFAILIPLLMATFYKDWISKLKSNSKSLKIEVIHHLTWLLICAPIWLRIPNQITERNGNRNTGGWSIGNWPTFSDVIGLSNWIPNTGIVTIPQFRFPYVILDLIFVPILSFWIYKLKKYDDKRLVLAVTYVFAVTLSSYIFLFLTSQDLKTYQIWKASFYFLPILILSISYSMISLGRKHKRNSNASFVFSLILIMICVAGITSSTDFSRYSYTLPRDLRESYENGELKVYWDNYDIQPVGYRSPQLFALLGENVYFSARADKPILGNTSIREKIWVVQKSSCETDLCENESQGLTLVKESESFLLFVKEK